jgi:hypothetical protein
MVSHLAVGRPDSGVRSQIVPVRGAVGNDRGVAFGMGSAATAVGRLGAGARAGMAGHPSSSRLQEAFDHVAVLIGGVS